MMTHPKSTAKNQTATIASVEVVDPLSLQLKLKAPSPALFVNLAADMALDAVELTSYYFPPDVNADYLHRLKQHAFRLHMLDVRWVGVLYFAVLREHGVAHVFNSWTRMPPIGDQLDLPGAVSGPFIVARALLQPGRTYDEAVDAFSPYDRIQDPSPALRGDLLRLIETAVHTRIPAYLLETAAEFTQSALTGAVQIGAGREPPTRES